MRLPHVRTILAVLPLLTALSPSAPAQDHLEPEEAVLNGDRDDWIYAKKLRTMLLKKPAPYYVARMTCLPSFDPEWVVTVAVDSRDLFAQKDKVAYYVQYAGAEKSLWHQKKKWRNTVVKKAQASLDEETAKAIEEVWRRMLRAVRYPEKDKNGLDGTSYHFSSSLNGFEQGQIHEPPADSLTRELATIGELLRNYAQARNEEQDKLRLEIRTKVAQLKAKLEGRRQPE